MRVHIWPSPEEVEKSNGIGRVVHAQYEHLPAFGVELTPDPARADVIAPHTTMGELPRVDVLHLHGVYWTGDPSAQGYQSWHYRLNEKIAYSARRAQVITVPSNWVAYPFQRDMRISPRVIGHGIDVAEYVDFPVRRGDYILWNKNRASDVCDPRWADILWSRGHRVTTTFTNLGSPIGYTVTGSLPADQMKRLVSECEIYLATTQETFGIGTLEALALGKPVLGFNWGGTADLVQHEQTGYLVEPGDVDGLEKGILYIREHYARLSRNARESSLKYDWKQSVIGQYAELYASIKPREYKVSFVITNYNYAKYVERAIKSAQSQTIPVEVVVVDDKSSDGSQKIIENLKPDVFIAKKQNEGVANARNDGIRASRGDYIVCLDADDFVAPEYAQALIGAFKNNHGLGVAYTGLTVVPEQGHPYVSHWPPEFSWEVQTQGGVPPGNCIPAGAMFSRKMWERAGGYVQAYAPGEDAEFWVRGLSLGFEAQKVAPDGLFYYQLHAGSASRSKQYRDIMVWHPWYNDKKYPLAAPHNQPKNPISAYPVEVSVIIPACKKHHEHIGVAISSVVGQTFRNWEIIAIPDSDISADYPEYPFVRWHPATGQPGKKRNIGHRLARGKYLLYLDADDYLHPKALSVMVSEMTKSADPKRYLYTDWVVAETGEPRECPDYSDLAETELLNPVTVLIAKSAAADWNEECRRLEDLEYFTRLYKSGIRGRRLPYPLLYVRQRLSTRTGK